LKGSAIVYFNYQGAVSSIDDSRGATNSSLAFSKSGIWYIIMMIMIIAFIKVFEMTLIKFRTFMSIMKTPGYHVCLPQQNHNNARRLRLKFTKIVNKSIIPAENDES
jgi:hypothetical protein